MISRNESFNNYINLNKISVDSQSISNRSINIIVSQLWAWLSSTVFIQSSVVSAIILITFVSIFFLWSFDSWSIFSFSRCFFFNVAAFQKIIVILKNFDDWDEWFLIIETIIKREKVDNYVNLIKFKSNEFVKSIILTFFSVLITVTFSTDFNED